MHSLLSHIIGDQHLIMHPERSLYWENENTLIIADLHVGKTGHFRKAGIGVPASVYKEDLIRLLGQILFFKAERLIIVGDLTHSIANRELDLFRKWRRDFSSLDVHLAKGNHDILDNKWYQEADIHVHNDPYKLGNFIFVHDARKPKLEVPSGEYVFCGHVHPAVHIKGKGKQSLKFPCFYFTNTYCILPAFSRFSGTYKIEAKTDEKIFAVVEKEIIQIKSKK